MVKQKICSYRGDHPSDIVEKIRKDSEIYKMPVKTVSLSSYVVGYASKHVAIVVFEAEQALEKMKEV